MGTFTEIRIQEALQRFLKSRGKEQVPLGVFMLWPRLHADLRRWATLDDDNRIRVSRAIFSLSSIGWTRWFIDEAISICPALEHELGDLSSQPHASVESVPRVEELSVSTNEGSTAGNAKNESPLNVDSVWAVIGEELTRLEGEWGQQPTRSLLSRVVALGDDASRLLEAMPVDRMPPRLLLENRLSILRGHLHEMLSGAELSWLGIDDLKGIMARWSLAMAEAPSDDLIVELANDAELAMDRLSIAIGEMRSVQESVDRAKNAMSVLENEVSQQASAIRRIELATRQLQAKEDAIAAERKQNAAMLFTLASASPRGEKFDPTVDYTTLLAMKSNEGGVRLEPPSVDDEGILLISSTIPINDLTDSVKAETVECDVIESTAECRSVIEVDNNTRTDTELFAASVELNTEPIQSAEVSESVLSIFETTAVPRSDAVEETTRQTDFTSSAGDQCRPIWELLEKGRASLAYQFSKALLENVPLLRVPPPSLLRSVALAPGLIASDGPLAVSIGEAFAEIDRAWFEPDDAPSKWHTALNLLLIAATLRPMVLAPAMGATAIASYRHLDGRYAALLELVRLVGDASEPLTGFTIGPAVLRSAADEASQKAQFAKLVKDADDWLFERAPSKKIRYAPASKVWQHWLKPGEAIHKLISPVARGAIDERNTVRIAVDELANYNTFIALVRDTDRRQLDRRGQDIEAGALEHLWVATCEAVALAKEWLGAESMLSDAGVVRVNYLGRSASIILAGEASCC